MLSRRVPRRDDERGVVMAAVLAISVVLVLFSMAAITQTVDGIDQAAVGAKQVDSTDAAEGGLQYVVTQLDNAASAGSATFSCPASMPLTSAGAFTTTYSMSYATASGSTAASTPTSAWSTCGGSISLLADTTYFFKAFGTTTSPAIGSRTLESAVFVGTGTTYAQSSLFPETLYAGLAVLGLGSFDLTGGNAYSGSLGACGTGWTYGGNYYSAGVPILPPESGVPGLPTTFDGSCAVTGNLYMNDTVGVILAGGTGVGGSVYDVGPTTFSLGAGVGGNVWSEGAVAMTGAGGVGGNIYSADPLLGVTITGATTVGGATGIDSAGPVTLATALGSGPNVTGSVDAGGLVTATSATIGGSVYGNGAVTITGGTVGGSVYANGLATLNTTVTGSVYSTGAVTIAGGTYNNIYADGPVTIAGGTVKGTIVTSGGITVDAGASVATVEDEGGTVVYLAKGNGPLYESGAILNLGLPPLIGPTATYRTAPSSWPVPWSLPYSYSAPALPAITTTVATQMVAAATSASGGSNQGTTTVPFPTLTYSGAAWTDNTAFCGSANPCAVSPTQTACSTTCGTPSVYTVTNDDCNATKVIGGVTVIDPSSVWQDIANMQQPGVLPTVIQTDCQWTWGNGALAGLTAGLKLYNNLAIFDTGGFSFTGSFTGVSSGDGNTHQFYAIVPSTPGVNLLPPLAGLPNGEASCTALLTGPDIIVNAPLTDSGKKIQDFLYTPSNVCSLLGSGVAINGRVYAGEMVDAISLGTSVNITAANITPWAAQAPGWTGTGGVTGPATPAVQSVTPG